MRADVARSDGQKRSASTVRDPPSKKEDHAGKKKFENSKGDMVRLKKGATILGSIPGGTICGEKACFSDVFKRRNGGRGSEPSGA